ncbi:hypothetical protein BBH99_14330 [Chryseobacterium contaminans]|uniref:Type I restriction modification DNA specificity domain-containing protein n=1 Tax=Chryseobacterium contaminans TaxID=1423959 RepID=A0ABX2X1I6_9FLAO|nr:restriction endonuclease subunit S [Chryseobacterium contaminans]OCA70362.1 hypothetical protein BBH99_14330 [Chryseobacterium contaminans]
MTNKKLKVSNVPNLRFPGFEGEWETKKLEEIGEIVTGSTPPTNNRSYYEGEYLFVSPVDIQTNRYIEVSKTTLTEKGFKKGRKIKKGSSLFVCIGSTIGKVGQANRDCITNQQINSIVTLENNEDFLFSLLEFYSPKIKALSAEQAVPIINKTTFSNVQVNIPELPEQKKIASFLSLIDERIVTQNKILLHYQSLIQKLRNDIFKQKLSFKDDFGNKFPEWEICKLSDISNRITQKNSENNQNVLTISAQLGLISQLDFFNKSVSSKNVLGYYFLITNDFAYNKSYSNGYPMGAIKRLKRYEKGVVSTLYICFRFHESVSIDFMEQYFESGIQNLEIEKIAQEGARNHGLLNVGISDFFDIKINIPSIEEQKQIASFLSKIESKIQTEKAILEQLETQKKYLLQQMFV